MPNRRTFRSARPQRRKLVWARASNLPGRTVVPAGAVIASDLLADYITQSGGDSLNGATLMAIRGRIFVDLGVATTTTGTMTVGIMRDSRQQVALPAAQLLATRAPATAGRYQDWLYRDYWCGPQLNAGVANRVSNTYDSIMVKSRRKLDELDTTVALYAENQQPGGVATLVLGFSLDLLLALP